MEKETWYIFTFGCGQKNEGHYVRFYGTYGEAREQMVREYGNEWAFQYSEEEWNDWLKRKPEWIPVETELV